MWKYRHVQPCFYRPLCVNSLTPWQYSSNFKSVIWTYFTAYMDIMVLHVRCLRKAHFTHSLSHSLVITYILPLYQNIWLPWSWMIWIYLVINCRQKLFCFVVRSWYCVCNNPSFHCSLVFWWPQNCHDIYLGMSPASHYWDYYPGALSFESSHCNSFEDRAPVDFIYGCPIFKWVAETWLHDRGPE